MFAVVVSHRTTQRELTHIGIDASIGIRVVTILTQSAVNAHRTHHSILQSAAQGNLDSSARRVGVVVGTSLWHNLNLGNILGFEGTDVVQEVCSRELHLALIYIEFRAACTIHRDIVILNPHAWRLTQQLLAILANSRVGVGDIHHKTIRLATYHLRLDNHLANLGCFLLHCERAKIGYARNLDCAVDALVAHKVHHQAVLARCEGHHKYTLLVGSCTCHLIVVLHSYNGSIANWLTF